MNLDSNRRFHFVREIASGTFGSVYLAKEIHADGFSRLVAIKVLHRRWSESEEVAQRMRDEARLLGWLRHPNIVNVLDLTSIDGRAAVVMEYLDAADLKMVADDARDQGEPVPLRASLQIVAASASALDAAYNRPPYEGEKPLRVIHRDIKPSNIMVDGLGVVKVLDFGVARADFDSRESSTRELQFGSVDYMPPERLFFEPETPASDIYSLGSTFYEILTSEKLGKAKGRPDKHSAFIQDRLSFLRAMRGLGGRMATGIESLLVRMLAYEHADRMSAADVVNLCRELSRRAEDADLQQWAEKAIGPLIQRLRDATPPEKPLNEQDFNEDSQILRLARLNPVQKEAPAPPGSEQRRILGAAALAALRTQPSPAIELEDIHEDSFRDVTERYAPGSTSQVGNEEAQSPPKESLPARDDPTAESESVPRAARVCPPGGFPSIIASTWSRDASAGSPPPPPAPIPSQARTEPEPAHEDRTPPAPAPPPLVFDPSGSRFADEEPPTVMLRDAALEGKGATVVVAGLIEEPEAEIPGPAHEPLPTVPVALAPPPLRFKEPPTRAPRRLPASVASALLVLTPLMGGGLGMLLFLRLLPDVLGQTRAVTAEGPATTQASIPKATPLPPTQPATPSDLLLGPNQARFTSASPETRKMQVTCGKDFASGSNDIVHDIIDGEPCMVTAIQGSRDRLQFTITSPRPGTWTCFKDDARQCTWSGKP